MHRSSWMMVMMMMMEHIDGVGGFSARTRVGRIHTPRSSQSSCPRYSLATDNQTSWAQTLSLLSTGPPHRYRGDCSVQVLCTLPGCSWLVSSSFHLVNSQVVIQTWSTEKGWGRTEGNLKGIRASSVLKCRFLCMQLLGRCEAAS